MQGCSMMLLAEGSVHWVPWSHKVRVLGTCAQFGNLLRAHGRSHAVAVSRSVGAVAVTTASFGRLSVAAGWTEIALPGA